MLTCVYSEGQGSLERHVHNAHELVYVREGVARFHIGDAFYEAGPHTLLFISKLEEHGVEILQEPYRRWWLRITPAQLSAAAEDPRLRTVFDCRPAEFCHAFDAGEAAGEIESLLSAMANEREAARSFGKQRQRALLSLLLITCYRIGREQFPRPARRVSEAVLSAQAYIDAHFCEELPLTELANRFFLSPSYLSHAFRDWTGHSPKQYIMLSRLSYARELLLTTNDGVEVIAARCGFGDVNNFIRSFRQQTGITPAAYRRAER